MNTLWFVALFVVCLIFLTAIVLWGVCAVRDAKEAFCREKKNYIELALVFAQLGMVVLMISVLVVAGFEIIRNL